MVEQTQELVAWSPNDMLEITFSHPDDFLKIKETLTRIGVASKQRTRLYQSCHILHKQGRYFITHFKELFLLDGKPSNLTQNDLNRRNTIVQLLSDWGMIEIISPIGELAPLSQIKIIAHKDKADWDLCPKYNIGITR